MVAAHLGHNHVNIVIHVNKCSDFVLFVDVILLMYLSSKKAILTMEINNNEEMRKMHLHFELKCLKSRIYLTPNRSIQLQYTDRKA